MKNYWNLFLGYTFLCIVPFSVIGQQTELTEPEKKTIVTSFSERLIKSYVFEDKAQKISSTLNVMKLPNDRNAFAKAIDDTIRSLSDDVHLRFIFDEQQYNALKQAVDTPDPGSEAENPDEKSSNYGFEKVEILNGNIGYLKINQFYETEAAFKAAEASMTFLRNVDAYIIDLSNNGGGSGKMGQFLASYFFEEGDNKLLLTNYNREANELIQEWSLFTINGKRVPDKPLYIIVSAKTGSAAEAFPYAMQAYKRAVVVGKKTWGGAHSGELLPIENGFIAFVPSGRVLSPVTNSNWEKVGVIPDVEIQSDLAIYKIQELLFSKWKQEETSEPRKNYLNWYEMYSKLKLNSEPVKLNPNLSGNYGDVNLRIENNKLIFGKTQELIPYSETVFFAKNGYDNSYKNDLIIEFDNPKKPTKLFYKVILKNGEIVTFPLDKTK